MLNCRRFKHVGLTQRIAQLPMPGRGFTFSSYVTQNNLLRQPLLLLRRPQRYLYNIRPPAEAATRQILGAGTARVGSKWTTRLLTFRRYLKINHGDTGGPDRSSFSLMQVLRSDYKRLFRLVQNEKTTLTVGLFCLFISSAITMSVPFFMGKVIDIVFNKDGMNDAAIKKLGEFSLMLFWIFVLGGCANCARVYLFGSSALRIVRRLRADLFRNMLLQEVAWFDSRGTGELINRLSNDTFFVGISLSQNVSDGLRSLAMVAVGSVMMMVTSLKLALVSAVVVPVLAGIAIVYGRYVRKITRAELDKYAMVMKHGEERLGNVRTVKVFTREQTESDDFNEKLNEALEIGYREIKARSIFFGLTGFSGNFSIISVLYYGGNLVLNDHLTIGAMTSFMLYAGYVAVAMNGLSNFYSHLNKGLGASERIWEILERQYDIPIGKGIRPAKRPEGEIMFQNVNFRYPTRPDSHVLKDFSLTLAPHSTTAVVGRSGAGKSTMAMLVMRLYDPKQGAIMLDGVDIRKLDPQWLRQNIGSVSQEPILFSGSIRSNILYGMHPGDLPSEDLLQQVVNDSHVVEFASRLPNGLETIVGQRGILLSGGQKQRVAIARALIKNPTILLLDEATSALDSVSEELVQKALDKLIQGRTVMTIAHRLSTIHKAHKIAVLDGGRVVEEGAFDELMRRPHGVFKELVAKQAFGGSYKSKTTAPDDHNDLNDLP